jgi:hypothetical protein
VVSLLGGRSYEVTSMTANRKAIPSVLTKYAAALTAADSDPVLRAAVARELKLGVI